MASRPSSAPHPVDQVPPFGKLTILGIQHVLAFYAGAVVVPLVIASGLGLDNHTLVHLINADLLTCGIATIIQSAGIGRFIGGEGDALDKGELHADETTDACGLDDCGDATGEQVGVDEVNQRVVIEPEPGGDDERDDHGARVEREDVLDAENC